ncbi:SET domain containing protein [Babesia caballi]|uniref:SET domain containing protein n=1 Tax=Babesia caballi TaxID=5871 RepID=A0AAV4M2M6_BABCB|nr:SET domain containing protein [Babesia caballi]
MDRTPGATRSHEDCNRHGLSPRTDPGTPTLAARPSVHRAASDPGVVSDCSPTGRDQMTPISVSMLARMNLNQRRYAKIEVLHDRTLESLPDNDVSTCTPVLTRMAAEKRRKGDGHDPQDVDPSFDISSFVKSSRYGLHGQKFRLFWLPNTEVSSLMRVPSIAELSKTQGASTERLYLVYTPGGMDVLQDVSHIPGVERRPFQTPFVVLYSYSFKSMYFKVVARVVGSCCSITFGDDGEPATVAPEEEPVEEEPSRRRPRPQLATTGYAFYRSYLYGIDDGAKSLHIRMSLRNVKDSDLDMRATSIKDEENSRPRLSANLRTPHNESEIKNDIDNTDSAHVTRSASRLRAELALAPSLDSLHFDGGVPSRTGSTDDLSWTTTRHGKWIYAPTNDHEEESDEVAYGLPIVLLTELKRLLGIEQLATAPQCNLSMVNQRMEAMIKRNFELYDMENQQLTANVKRDLKTVADKEQNSQAMFVIGDRVLNVGDLVVVKFPTFYRGYSEEERVKIYPTEVIIHFFDLLEGLSAEGPTDLTIALAQYCPNIFWNLTFCGDLDGALRRMAPNVYGNVRKRRRAAARNDSPVTTVRSMASIARPNHTPVFDNNFVIMQNLFERDAQTKIARLEKIHDQQRDPNGKFLRCKVSKYLDSDQLIETVMDADGFLLKSMQALTPAQKNVVYQTCLRRGIYAPIRLDYLPVKGRAVFAAYDIGKDEFVVEYKGQIITEKLAKFRDRKYDNSRSHKGSFVFYFRVQAKRYCIDATEEDIKFGPARLINHSRKNPNVLPKALEIDGCPRLFFVAKRDIKCGEELLIDYGERDPSRRVTGITFKSEFRVRFEERCVVVRLGLRLLHRLHDDWVVQLSDLLSGEQVDLADHLLALGVLDELRVLTRRSSTYLLERHLRRVRHEPQRRLVVQLASHRRQDVAHELVVQRRRLAEPLDDFDVDLGDGDLVDFVEHVEAGDVDAIPLDDVDDVVHGRVAADRERGVADAVLVADGLDDVLVHVIERHGVRHRDPALVLAGEGDVRRRLVESDPEALHLLFQQPLVVHRLGRVEHDQNEPAGPRDGNDLLTATLAVLRTLDNPRQVEQLDFRPLVLKHARHARQRGELVRRHLGVRAGQLVQQRGLAHRGEADQSDACVSGFRHVEPLPRSSTLTATPLNQLCAQLRQLRLQQPQVEVRGLVLLCPGHLGLDLRDLLEHRHCGYFLLYGLTKLKISTKGVHIGRPCERTAIPEACRERRRSSLLRESELCQGEFTTKSQNHRPALLPGLIGHLS